MRPCARCTRLFAILKNRFDVYVYPPVCHVTKPYYFLVCERFPLFAILKNRCGKKRAPIWGPSHGKIPLYIKFNFFQKLYSSHTGTPLKPAPILAKVWTLARQKTLTKRSQSVHTHESARNLLTHTAERANIYLCRARCASFTTLGAHDGSHDENENRRSDRHV